MFRKASNGGINSQRRSNVPHAQPTSSIPPTSAANPVSNLPHQNVPSITNPLNETLRHVEDSLMDDTMENNEGGEDAALIHSSFQSLIQQLYKDGVPSSSRGKGFRMRVFDDSMDDEDMGGEDNDPNQYLVHSPLNQDVDLGGAAIQQIEDSAMQSQGNVDATERNVIGTNTDGAIVCFTANKGSIGLFTTKDGRADHVTDNSGPATILRREERESSKSKFIQAISSQLHTNNFPLQIMEIPKLDGISNLIDEVGKHKDTEISQVHNPQQSAEGEGEQGDFRIFWNTVQQALTRYKESTKKLW